MLMQEVEKLTKQVQYKDDQISQLEDKKSLVPEYQVDKSEDIIS